MRVCVHLHVFVVECVQGNVRNMWVCECGEREMKMRRERVNQNKISIRLRWGGGMRGQAGGLSVMHYAYREFMGRSEQPRSGLCISEELSINVQFIHNQLCSFIILSAVFHDWV